MNDLIGLVIGLCVLIGGALIAGRPLMDNPNLIAAIDGDLYDEEGDA
jgi:hypothetical protein